MMLNKGLQQLGIDSATAKKIANGTSSLNKPYQQNPDVAGTGSNLNGIKSAAKTATGVASVVAAPAVIGTQLIGRGAAGVAKLTGKGAKSLGKRALASKPAQWAQGKVYTLADKLEPLSNAAGDFVSNASFKAKENFYYYQNKLAQSKLGKGTKRAISGAKGIANTAIGGAKTAAAWGKDKAETAALYGMVAADFVGNQIKSTAGYRLGKAGMRQIKNAVTSDGLFGTLRGSKLNREAAQYATAMMMNSGVPLGIGAIATTGGTTVNLNDFSMQKTYKLDRNGSNTVVNLSELAPAIKQYGLKGREANKLIEINKEDAAQGIKGSEYYQQALVEALKQTEGSMSTGMTREVALRAEGFKRESDERKRQEMISGIDNNFNINAKKREALEDILKNSSGSTAQSIERYKMENLGMSDMSEGRQNELRKKAIENIEQSADLSQEERKSLMAEKVNTELSSSGQKSDEYITEIMIQGILDDPKLAEDILGPDGAKEYEKKLENIKEEREKAIRTEKLVRQKQSYEDFSKKHSEYSNLSPVEMQGKMEEHEIKANVQEAVNSTLNKNNNVNRVSSYTDYVARRNSMERAEQNKSNTLREAVGGEGQIYIANRANRISHE